MKPARAVLALIAAAVLWPSAPLESTQWKTPTVGQSPPALNAADLSGRRHSLSQYRQRVVLVHFWATWCPYCRGEVPKLKRLAQAWTADDVVVLAVSVDEDLQALRAFVQQQRLPYPVIPDAAASAALANRYGVEGIPVTYLIGRDGRIAAKFVGPADLVGEVRRLVEPPKPST